MPPIVTVKNLCKAYGRTVAVDNISFDVQEGEVFGILGPNGAGKTTTIECLRALKRPDSGDVRVVGYDPVKKPRAIRKVTGCWLQKIGLPDRLSVMETLEQFALNNTPRVLFLDEMTNGLDPVARRVAWEIIREIRRKGTTILLVTQFMDEAENLCDRLAILDHGKVVALDTPQQLIHKYAGNSHIIFTAERADLTWLNRISGVEKVVVKGKSLEVEGSGAVLARVAVGLMAHGIAPADLRMERSTLEDVFFKVTYNSVLN